MRHVPLFFGERIVVRVYVCGTVCQWVSQDYVDGG